MTTGYNRRNLLRMKTPQDETPVDSATKMLGARIPPELHRELRIRAIHEGRSVAELVEDAVRMYLAQTAEAAEATS